MKNKRKDAFTYGFVKQFFADHGCILLSKEYQNSKQKLEYQCSCGSKSIIEFRNFRSGKRCNKCSRYRANVTNTKNHGGKLSLTTPEFLAKRKLTYMKHFGFDSPLKNPDIEKRRIQTNTKKYGVSHPSSLSPIKSKIRETMKHRYGSPFCMQVESIKTKCRETMLERYGVPSCGYLMNSYSKDSQTLFWKVLNLLPMDMQKHCYFAEHQKEFCIYKNLAYYKYDFVNTLTKTCIEYNGWNFHPKITQQGHETGWFAFDKTKTVLSAREYEQQKYAALEERAFSILTIWDKEYKANEQTTIKLCVDFTLKNRQ